ncbi:MAG: hypothetical protein IT410_01360 [Candidatus Doudnabacteria bacterium]|nr:hypothetical protein [Candidatus Doudnabacteria bacterium]
MKQFGWYIAGIIVLGMVILGMFVGDVKKAKTPLPVSTLTNTAKTTDKTQANPLSEKFDQTMIEFTSKRPEQQWLFSGSQMEATDLAKFTSVSKSTIQKAENSFKTYSNIPEVKQFADKYSGKLYVSLFSSATNAPMMMGRTGDAFKGHNDPSYLEICLFDSKARQNPRNQLTLLSFNPRFNSIMLASIDFKEPWFSAFFLHEMYHVKKFREGAQSSKNNQYGTDLWISEEVESHELETKVLDSATKGKFLAAVNAIVEKRKDQTDVNLIPSSLTLEELNSLDGLFPPCSKDEVPFRLSQYIFTTGFSWLEKRFSGAELQKKKIDYYRFITSQFG